MHEVELFVGSLVAVVLVALAGRRLRRLPNAVALVLGGIAVGLMPFAPEIRLDPEVIFLVFLPPILYPSAYDFATEDVRANLRPIAFLAIGLVLVTMAAIAAVAHFVAGIPWAAAFVLGAVLAPTDPVAATAVIRSSGAPERLATILEGESLINDGTALTALRIAIASVGGTFSLSSAAGEFVVVALGGAAVGAALAWLVSLVLRRIDDVELESTIAVLLAYGAFLAAEQVHVSGVLATVFAGYVIGRRTDVSSAETRMGGSSFWGVAQFLAESMLFLLVGLAFAQVLNDPSTRGTWETAGITALVVVTAVATRVAWMFSVAYLGRLFDRAKGGLETMVSARERLVIGFGGLRGAVSVAAALTIPASVDGTDFPERATLTAIALGAIVVLLIGPALGLPRLLRAAGLEGVGDSGETARRARAEMARAAVRRLEEVAEGEDLPEDVLFRLRDRYELRLRQLRALGGDGDGDGGQEQHRQRAEAVARLRLAAVEAQRSTLDDLRSRGVVSGELLRSLRRDLDLEEARARE